MAWGRKTVLGYRRWVEGPPELGFLLYFYWMCHQQHMELGICQKSFVMSRRILIFISTESHWIADKAFVSPRGQQSCTSDKTRGRKLGNAQTAADLGVQKRTGRPPLWTMPGIRNQIYRLKKNTALVPFLDRERIQKLEVYFQHVGT